MRKLIAIVPLLGAVCLVGCEESYLDKKADAVRDQSQMQADQIREGTQQHADDIRNNAGKTITGAAQTKPAENAADRVEEVGEQKADAVEQAGENKADAIEEQK